MHQYTSTASYFQTATQIMSFCYFQGRVDRSQSIFRLHSFRFRFSHQPASLASWECTSYGVLRTWDMY